MAKKCFYRYRMSVVRTEWCWLLATLEVVLSGEMVSFLLKIWNNICRKYLADCQQYPHFPSLLELFGLVIHPRLRGVPRNCSIPTDLHSGRMSPGHHGTAATAHHNVASPGSSPSSGQGPDYRGFPDKGGSPPVSVYWRTSHIRPALPESPGKSESARTTPHNVSTWNSSTYLASMG